MHILIIASWYKSEPNTTEGSFIEEQARMLQKAGHKVSVIHPFVNGTFSATLKGAKTVYHEENDNEILTARISTNVLIPKIRTHSYQRLFKKTRNYFNEYVLKNGNPDIIHSHALFMGGIIGHYLSKKYDIPHLHTEHTSGLIFNPNQYTKSDINLLKRVYSNCEKVFFVSSYALYKVKELYNLEHKNLIVLHNIVDSSFFNFRPIGIKNELFNYIAIGSLIKRKHFDFLLNAWAKFIEQDKESFLTIAGSGPELNNLNKLINDLNLHQTVKIIPKLSRAEVKSYIDKSNVLISTSKLETFGLTVAEAIASGRPVVVTDSGGVQDIVDESNGVITNFDLDSFANALVSIKANYYKYNLKQISQDAKEKFGEQTIYEKLNSHYESIL